MIRLGTIALAVVVVAGASPAFAQSKPVPLTVDTVSAALTAAGKTFSTSTAEDGTTILEIDTAGSKAAQLEVVFFDCAQPAGPCDSIMAWSWYQLPTRVTADKINEWNAQSRWTRAYIDSDKDPRLEQDIYGKGGISPNALETLLVNFFGYGDEFAGHLGL